MDAKNRKGREKRVFMQCHSTRWFIVDKNWQRNDWQGNGEMGLQSYAPAKPSPARTCRFQRQDLHLLYL